MDPKIPPAINKILFLSIIPLKIINENCITDCSLNICYVRFHSIPDFIRLLHIVDEDSA